MRDVPSPRVRVRERRRSPSGRRVIDPETCGLPGHRPSPGDLLHVDLSYVALSFDDSEPV